MKSKKVWLKNQKT